MIENVGEAPIAAFQIMGVSTTRGEEGTIGMFGSGTKYAICTLLRHNYEVIIYSGLTRLEFRVADLTVDDGLKSQTFQQVVCLITLPDGNVTESKLNIVLQHGELDWKKPHMAFREFVANALDRTWRQRQSYDIEWCPIREPEGCLGTTRVFLTRKPELDEYLDRIHERFLHFSKQHNQKILPKTRLSPVKFYKSGVLVGEGAKNSVFDYNLPDFELTESRVLNPDGVGRIVAQQFFYDGHMTAELVKLITRNEVTYETMLWNEFFGCWAYVKSYWIETYGPNAVPYHSVEDLMMLQKDGSKQPVWVQDHWVKVLGSNGIIIPSQVQKTLHKRQRRETRSELLDRIHIMAKSFSELEKPQIAITDSDDASIDDNVILIPRKLIGSEAFDEQVIRQAATYYFRFSESNFYIKLLMRFLCPSVED